MKTVFLGLKLLTVGVMVASFTSAWAEHWVRVASSETSYFYADKDSVKKTGEFYYLSVKRNSKDDQKKSSSLLKYKIDCTNNAYQLEDSKVFTDMDLAGDEVYSKPQGLGEMKVAAPNSIGEKYVRVVCDDFKNSAKDTPALKEKKPAAAPSNSTVANNSANRDESPPAKEQSNSSISNLPASSDLMLILEEMAGDNQSCKFSFKLKNNRSAAMKNNSIVGVFDTKDNRRYNQIETTQGKEPGFLVQYKLLEAKSTVSGSAIVSTRCENIISLNMLGFFSIDQAVKDGFVDMKNLKVIDNRVGDNKGKLSYSYDEEFNRNASYMTDPEFRKKTDAKMKQDACFDVCKKQFNACFAQYNYTSTGAQICAPTQLSCGNACKK